MDDASAPTAAAPTREPGIFRTLGATITGNLYLVAGTLFFSVLAILAAAIPPRGDWTYRVARLWARLLLFSSWIPLRTERPDAPAEERRDRPPAGGSVFLANHQSLFDIPALLVAIPGQTRFMAKRSLFQIPIFGWAIRLGGFIPVDRKDRSSARDSFASAMSRLRHGVSILIFPEETRSLDGALLPFQRGGILLAMKSGLPVVPTGVEGTLAVQSRRSFLIRPRAVTVRFGERRSLEGRSVRELAAIGEEMRTEVARLARAPRAANPKTKGAPESA